MDNGVYIEFSVLTEFNLEAFNMATFTVNIPDEDWKRWHEKFPEVNWNEVIKRGLIKRLEELKKMRERGEL